MKMIVVAETPDGMLEGRPNGPQPGDVWYDSDMLHFPYLSAAYKSLPEPRRLPIVVCMPPGGVFCVDSQQSTKERGFFEPGWTVDVSRGLEYITVTPSVNVEGWWHGFITNGDIA